MSHLKLPKTFLSLILGTVALQGAAVDLGDAGKIAPAVAQSFRWYVTQMADTTPQTIIRAPTLGDNALELELPSKYGIAGTELQTLASELRSRLLTKETINRYQIGADAAQYAAQYDDKIKPMLASQQKPRPAVASPQSAGKSSGGMVHIYQWSTSTGGLVELEVDEKGCRRHPTNELYNKRIQVLGNLALRKADPCLTTAYLEGNYNAGGNEVHAGIDFRAEKSIDNVYAIADGEIVVGSSFDGKARSTLIIETADKRYKVLYLHMSSLDPLIQEGTNVKVGKLIKAGDPLGVAGDVGLGPGGAGPHLHIELWHASAPQYHQARSLAAVNGNCPASKKGLCDADTIKFRTLDPAGLPKLDEEKIAEAKLPPLPLIVPSAKVPSAYGTGSWELRKPAKLFSAAKPSSAVIRVLSEGTKVEAQKIEFHVLRYRISEAVGANSVEVLSAMERKNLTLTLRQGDVIAEFSNSGDEGNNIIFRGRAYSFFQGFASDDLSRQLNPFYDTVLWARVKTKEGTVGWLQDPDAKGMSRYD